MFLKGFPGKTLYGYETCNFKRKKLLFYLMTYWNHDLCNHNVYNCLSQSNICNTWTDIDKKVCNGSRKSKLNFIYIAFSILSQFLPWMWPYPLNWLFFFSSTFSCKRQSWKSKVSLYNFFLTFRYTDFE